MNEYIDAINWTIKNNKNCLLISEHGTGKSSIVLEALKNHKLKYNYFSAALIDPFTQLTGIPFSAKSSDGTSYIDYAMPKDFDSIEAIFIDEFNRAPKRTLSSLMELIQFRTINDRPLKNLRCVFAAINPHDESADEQTYNVEYIDPAQYDRFHCVLRLKYGPDYEWFKNKFGQKNAETAIEWWNKLDKKQKLLVSPRRLEYVLNAYETGANLRWLLPEDKVNISSLISQLSIGSYSSRMREIFKNKDTSQAQKLINDQNFFYNTKEDILKNKEMIEFFLPHLNKEDMTALQKTDTQFMDYVKNNIESFLFAFRDNNTNINFNTHDFPPDIKKRILSIDKTNSAAENNKDDLSAKFKKKLSSNQQYSKNSNKTMNDDYLNEYLPA